MEVKIKIAEAAVKNSITTDFISKRFDEKASIPCAMIFGINMFTALPKSAIIIKRITIPEYGFSKLKMPVLWFLSFEVLETGLSMIILINLQRNSIKPVIHSKTGKNIEFICRYIHEC
jgi:hypothetical protein